MQADDLEVLVEHVLRLVSGSTPSDDQLSLVIRNYYRDGPKVEALLDRDSPQGDQLWQDIRSIYLRTGLARLSDLAQAEDVAQQALKNAFQNLSQFGFRAKLETWLTEIWKSACAEAGRREQAKKRGGAGRDSDGSSPPRPIMISLDAQDEVEAGSTLDELDEVESTQISQHLFDLLAQLLNNDDVTILRLYYVEQTYLDPREGELRKWTDATIAHLLEWKKNKVTSRRHRALERLKRNPDIRRLFEDTLGISLKSRPDRKRRKTS